MDVGQHRRGQPTSALAHEDRPSHHGADVDDLIAQVGVAFDDGQLYIRGPRLSGFRRKKGLDLTIKVPPSGCAAKTVSADLAAVGELSGLTMQTASGDVERPQPCTGNVTVQSASGDVLLQAAGRRRSRSTRLGRHPAASVDGDARDRRCQRQRHDRPLHGLGAGPDGQRRRRPQRRRIRRG